ncbi:hypothetical protein [Thiolapillus sp.]|uniref:hypothetical protein n=1 Tax=Thiolapillus sp. TaxID=2017437 RepID=UPI0025F28B6F|nr:hypothetical protein [Thiolapillus sp.]
MVSSNIANSKPITSDAGNGRREASHSKNSTVTISDATTSRLSAAGIFFSAVFKTQNTYDI